MTNSRSPKHTPPNDALASDAFIQDKVVPLMKQLVRELKDIVLATQEDKDFRPVQFPTDGPNGEMGRMMQEMSGVGETPSIQESRAYNASMHRAASALIEVGEKAGMVELALLVAELRERSPELRQSKGGIMAVRPQAAAILHQHYPTQIPFVALAKPPVAAAGKEESAAAETPGPARTASKATQVYTRRGVLGLVAGGAAYMLYNGHEERKSARAELKQMQLDEIDIESKGPTMTVEERKKLLTLQRITRPETEEKTSIPASHYLAGIVGGGALIGLFADIAASNGNTPKRILVQEAPPDFDLDNDDGYSPAPRPAHTPVADVLRQLDDTLQEASINGKFHLPTRSENARAK